MKADTPVIRVVDDDLPFRTAIARWLTASGFKVKLFASAAEFLANPQTGIPGCVLLDLEMPLMGGLDLQAAMTQAGVALPVVFLSGQADIPQTVLAMRRGAEDFLTKSCPEEALLEVIHRAVARDSAERAARARLGELRARLATLTEREREILRHVLQGKLNKQIAADLGIHERTVKLHRTHITTKLQVQSVAALTRLAQEAGFS